MKKALNIILLLIIIVLILIFLVLGYWFINESIRGSESVETSESTIAVSTTTEESTTTTTTAEPTSTTTEATTTTEASTTAESTTTQAPTVAQTAAPTTVPATPTPIPVSPDGRSGSQLDTPFTINGIVVVNKNHWVSRNYRPLPDHKENNGLLEPAWTAFLNMKADAAAEGITLVHISSYRTYERQQMLFRNYSARAGEAAANRYSARAGKSEHQTGLAIDITAGGGLVQAFADTAEGQWLWENAYKYGFILRYPQGKEHITGYMFEPWHYRYVGVDVAADFGPNHTLTLEEYLGTN